MRDISGSQQASQAIMKLHANKSGSDPFNSMAALNANFGSVASISNAGLAHGRHTQSLTPAQMIKKYVSDLENQNIPKL